MIPLNDITFDSPVLFYSVYFRYHVFTTLIVHIILYCIYFHIISYQNIDQNELGLFRSSPDHYGSRFTDDIVKYILYNIRGLFSNYQRYYILQYFTKFKFYRLNLWLCYHPVSINWLWSISDLYIESVVFRRQTYSEIFRMCYVWNSVMIDVELKKSSLIIHCEIVVADYNGNITGIQYYRYEKSFEFTLNKCNVVLGACLFALRVA